MPPSDDRPPTSQDARERRSFFLQLAHYSHLAFVLPAATFVGWLFGALLDKWLHTSWLYLAGVFLGIAAGFVELIRAVMASDGEGES